MARLPLGELIRRFDEILTFFKAVCFSCQVVLVQTLANSEIFSVSAATAHYSPTFGRQPKRLIPFI
jgi:hypothetical protein